MKKKFLFCAFCACCSLLCLSCGSTWEISGNNIEVSVCESDTIVPAGTIIMKVDTMPIVKD